MYSVFLFFLLVGLESFLGLEPGVLDLGVNVDHELEDEVEEGPEDFLVLLGDGGHSLEESDEEFYWLVADGVVGVVVLGDDGVELSEDLLEVGAEELGLDLCQFVELDEGVLQYGLFVCLEGLNDHLGHGGEKRSEVLGVLLLCDLEEVGDGLEGGEGDVQVGLLESGLENAHQVLLVLDQVLHLVAEQPVEDLKSCVDLEVVLRVDELEQHVQQLLPHVLLLLLIQGAAHFDDQVADLVAEDLLLVAVDDLEQLSLDVVLGGWLEALPQVLVVGLVLQVLGVAGSGRDVPSEDDCC